MRLVDADAMFAKFKNGESDTREEKDFNRLGRHFVRHAPTIDAALVVHGKWIKDGPYRAVSGNYNKSVTCSVCNSLFVSNGNEPWALHPFCCECGAKMEEESNGL